LLGAIGGPKPGGWIALTEADELFGHRPLGKGSRELLADYADHALQQGWYDFHMGHKLADYAKQAGFKIVRDMRLEDAELAFTGPANEEVVDSWRRRFDRMKQLQRFCGSRFSELAQEFLDCLVRPDHQCDSSVCFCIAKMK
jgi:hypothetical protein